MAVAAAIAAWRWATVPSRGRTARKAVRRARFVAPGELEHRARRRYLVVCVLCWAALLGWRRVRVPSREQVLTDDLAVEAEIRGWYVRWKHGYRLSVTADGVARVVAGYEDELVRVYAVPADLLAELRAALAEERWFELDRFYGCMLVKDSSVRDLRVHIGWRGKAVRLYPYYRPGGELPDLRRAARVWGVVERIARASGLESLVQLADYDRCFLDDG